VNCKEARAAAIEHARSGSMAVNTHFEACAECRRFLQAQVALHSAFAALAHDVPAPPNLEVKLLAEFEVASRRTPVRLRGWLPAVVAASLAIASVVLYHRTVLTPRIVDGQFIAIPYTAPLAPYERTSIVRMDVPVAALIAAGFDVHAPDARVAVRADVLFGQDGRAHAIRLITNSVSNSKVEGVIE
jgi:hypothetical protein